ncbi:uncharacterized protein LOC9649867 isoform X1 [Selaginella moellendorffii]|uniref:uncharacterized protein LOC9649867 isoform X1 n=1 Tax=Selaginella moellendorffii TaxID=88036 RepID=UPI000D1CA8D2|nr:uncharacterized protein LOC9649867 isoform X1 [Selaginella moellendorffii]|eukprot:XP_024515079.1 uncharacterized protein LOC9649867 isoform X1 [Selaginella moellendorffii]
MRAKLWSDERVRTLVLVNLASVMEQADEALLPGVYKEIGESLHTGLAALGSLTLLRSITQALCFPFAAYFSLHYDRSKVIAIGAFLWSIATFFVGISQTFTQVSRRSIVLSSRSRSLRLVGLGYLAQIAVWRALNGVGLALVVPAIQSLVADACDESKRGQAFGWLQLTGSVGTILGGFLSIILAGTSFLGISGWRLSFLLVTAISVVLGILLLIFAVDPAAKAKRERGFAGVWSGLKEATQEGKMVINVKTFQFLVAQGVVGTFPWASLAFAPLWLELKGFSHTHTAFLLGLFTACGSLGGLFAGTLGDTISKHLPDSGRIILAQFSSGSGVPLTAILLLGLPPRSNSLLLHALIFAVLGFCTSWNAPATNNPIFAEIVPEKSRTTIYALDRSFESVLASFAPPIVGLLAEHLYGYVPPPPTSKNPVEANSGDAVSLGKALYTAYAIPMATCCLTYTFLYWSYPKDRDRVVNSFQAQTEMSTGLSKVTYEKSSNGYFVNEELQEDKEEHEPEAENELTSIIGS